MAIQWNELYEGGRDYGTINQFLLNLALEKARAPEGGSALDIGCGTGDLAVKLARRGYRVKGVDLADAAIEKAKQRSEEGGTADKTDFAVLDIENPEQAAQLNGEKFDLITCKLVYAFIQDKEAFLAWVKDHLSENGAFVLITPVLHEGIEYNKRLNSISVPLAELQNQLSNAFSSISDIHTDYFEEWGDERTIIAR